MTATVRRLKTYSSESGYVYQYFFLESKTRRRLFGPGDASFRFSVSSDRKSSFPVEVVVEGGAQVAWEKRHGRPLTETEKYAAAKMRLFRAFDESSGPGGLEGVRVSASNIEEVLAPLRLDE